MLTTRAPSRARQGPGSVELVDVAGVRGRGRRLEGGGVRVARFLAARPSVTVAGLALVAASWAVVFSQVVFPHLSDNHDEAIYLLQADALRHGHLFPPAPAPAEAFLPWLGVTVREHFVLKYTPVHAGIIAASRVLFGSHRAALALIAAGGVVAAYLLAREVLASRGQAALAAGFLAASPLFLIQSATFLAYLSTMVLLMGFAAALLAGTRRHSRPLLALSGFLLATAVFARPFDALLFAAPFGAWWAVGRRTRLRALVAEAGWIALGAALPVAAMLGYFHAATGSPFRLPFTLSDPSDTLGFGIRRMVGFQTPLHYTPARALQGVVRLAGLTGFWVFGGFALLGLALAGIRPPPTAAGEAHDQGQRPRRTADTLRRWRAEPALWLGLTALTVPLGYAFFWGSYGSTEWGGPWRFGPFYWLPILAPIVILGAAGFHRLWSTDRLVAGLGLAGMVALSAFIVVRAVDQHLPYTARGERVYAASLQALSLDEPALVFLPQLRWPNLLQPYALARNPTFDGPVIWSVDRGGKDNLEVLRRFPGRTPYLVVGRGPGDRPVCANVDDTTMLQRLRVQPYPPRLVPDDPPQLACPSQEVADELGPNAPRLH